MGKLNPKPYGLISPRFTTIASMMWYRRHGHDPHLWRHIGFCNVSQFPSAKLGALAQTSGCWSFHAYVRKSARASLTRIKECIAVKAYEIGKPSSTVFEMPGGGGHGPLAPGIARF